MALALMVIATILCLVVVKGAARLISYLALAVSVVLLVAYRAPWPVWEDAVETNLYMVVMFALVPILKIPLRFGGYHEALQSMFRRHIDTRGRFYVFVGLVSAFIGSVVNLAVVPLVHEVSRASPLSADKKLVSAAMTRGFTSTTVWAPTMASMALIMQLTGAEWVSFFPVGLGGGILAGLVGYLVTRLEDTVAARRATGRATLPALGSSGGAAPSSGAPASAAAVVGGVGGRRGGGGEAAGDGGVGGRRGGGRRGGGPLDSGGGRVYAKFAELCVFTIALIGVIAAVSFVTGIHTISVVALAALVFPVVWMGLLRRLRILGREFRRTYFGQSLPALRSEVTLFVAAGFFATSLEYSGLGAHIARGLLALTGENVLLLTLAIVAAALVLAAAGVHPIVTVAIVGGTVRSAAMGVSPVYMAMVLAICWAIGLSISPSSATIIAAAGLTGQSPTRVGPRWNGVYAAASAATLIAMITALRVAGLI